MFNVNVFDEVKQCVSMTAAAELWGIRVNRSGFACCPFHDEATPSMRIYDDHFYCFGCGKGGDVIKFTELYFGLSPLEAVSKLNTDFNLGLETGKKIQRAKVLGLQSQREYKDNLYEAFLAEENFIFRRARATLRIRNPFPPPTPEDGPSRDWIMFEQYQRKCSWMCDCLTFGSIESKIDLVRAIENKEIILI